MSSILKNNTPTIILISLCLLIGAGTQLLVPRLIYQVFENLLNGVPWAATSILVAIMVAIKGISMTLSTAYSALLEVRICYTLRKLIHSSKKNLTTGQKITLLKEDAERVASAIVEILNLIASMTLTATAATYLLLESHYFLFPLSITVLCVLLYLKVARPGIESRYKNELQNDELYKSELSELITSHNKPSPIKMYNFGPLSDQLQSAVAAKYTYEKWRFFVTFMPEIALAASTVAVLVCTAFWTPEIFSSKIIIYLGYLGLISMSSINIVDISFSLLGADQSVNRIRSAQCH